MAFILYIIDRRSYAVRQVSNDKNWGLQIKKRGLFFFFFFEDKPSDKSGMDTGYHIGNSADKIILFVFISVVKIISIVFTSSLYLISDESRNLWTSETLFIGLSLQNSLIFVPTRTCWNWLQFSLDFLGIDNFKFEAERKEGFVADWKKKTNLRQNLHHLTSIFSIPTFQVPTHLLL